MPLGSARSLPVANAHSEPNYSIPASSQAAFARAQRVLVGGVNSPVRAFGGVGGTPVFVKRALGPLIFDLDDRPYLDLVGAWGPAILGHAHPHVVAAIARASEDGLSFGAPSSAETELAELILSALPGHERLRFVSSGTEAVMSALRLARGVTNRSLILKFAGNYHGHADGLLVAAGSGAATHGVPSSAGVPPEMASLTLVAPYNDPEALEHLFQRHGNQLACVVVEPIAGNMGFVRGNSEFLQGLRRLCTHYGTLLIFDEVMTGFRVAWGGVQVQLGIQPDLTCLAKVIGGGLPVGAYCGPARYLDQVSPAGPVYQAGTLSGNPVCMAAGLATLKLCSAPGFYESLDAQSQWLVQELQTTAQRHRVPLVADAAGGMLGLFLADHPVRNFSDACRTDGPRFARFFHAMLQRGIWLPPSRFEAWFISSAHTTKHLEIVTAAAHACWKEWE
jgi:glutamate-1-semialdehyde 2,1-aminomutase